MKISRATCRSCGTPLLWAPDLSHRPLEATPSVAFPHELGFVVRRNRDGSLSWFQSRDCAEPPEEHLRVHGCAAWRDEQRDKALDALHISNHLLDEIDRLEARARG